MRFSGTQDYVATDDLKVAVNAAITLRRPLLVKGEPGTGKTVLAEEIAKAFDAPLIMTNGGPGTAGTLWAWIAFIALSPWMTDARWAVLIAVSLPVGWWACSITARNMGVLDPGSVVWDEVVAFWLVLWLVMPTGLVGQVLAFGLFRFFDAVKPGPVGWADRLYHALDPASDPTAWRKAGFGVLVVAALRFFA